MPELIHWPFPLPDQFLDQLGYGRAVATLESPAMVAHVAELLRRQGLDVKQAAPTGPGRYVLLHWESAGDELAWSDGAHSGAGQLNHWTWLDYLHGRHHVGPIYGWLVEHEIHLGNSDEPATHALIVDAASNAAWIAPIVLAHRIVRRQALADEASS